MSLNQQQQLVALDDNIRRAQDFRDYLIRSRFTCSANLANRELARLEDRRERLLLEVASTTGVVNHVQ